MNTKWTTANIPSLTGKVAIVTGGNVGLGYQSSLEMAKRGAAVVIACRNIDKGNHAIALIQAEAPTARLDIIPLDLTDRKSIEYFATTFKERYQQLDILLNNAGVVSLETYQKTADGHEMHMATNHLGHFALTGLLYPLLQSTDKARVVTVSSGGYRFGTIDFEDFAWKKRPYSAVRAYGDSKLANLLFMMHLQTHFERSRTNALSVAAHPGLTGTERQQTTGMGGFISRWAASSVSMGCLPQLRAATEPSVEPRDFYGPRFGIRGYPVKQKLKANVFDKQLAEDLWLFSEKFTGVRYNNGLGLERVS